MSYLVGQIWALMYANIFIYIFLMTIVQYFKVLYTKWGEGNLCGKSLNEKVIYRGTSTCTKLSIDCWLHPLSNLGESDICLSTYPFPNFNSMASTNIACCLLYTVNTLETPFMNSSDLDFAARMSRNPIPKLYLKKNPVYKKDESRSWLLKCRAQKLCNVKKLLKSSSIECKW